MRFCAVRDGGAVSVRPSKDERGLTNLRSDQRCCPGCGCRLSPSWEERGACSHAVGSACAVSHPCEWAISDCASARAPCLTVCPGDGRRSCWRHSKGTTQEALAPLPVTGSACRGPFRSGPRTLRLISRRQCCAVRFTVQQEGVGYARSEKHGLLEGAPMSPTHRSHAGQRP